MHLSSLDQQPSGFMLKKNVLVTLVEDGKADFLQATGTGVGTTAMGSPREGESTLTQPGKVEFLAKEQGEASVDHNH